MAKRGDLLSPNYYGFREVPIKPRWSRAMFENMCWRLKRKVKWVNMIDHLTWNGWKWSQFAWSVRGHITSSEWLVKHNVGEVIQRHGLYSYIQHEWRTWCSYKTWWLKKWRTWRHKLLLKAIKGGMNKKTRTTINTTSIIFVFTFIFLLFSLSLILYFQATRSWSNLTISLYLFLVLMKFTVIFHSLVSNGKS